MSTSDELDEIRKASEHLYDALYHMLNGDSCLMDSIRSHSAPVTIMRRVYIGSQIYGSGNLKRGDSYYGQRN